MAPAPSGMTPDRTSVSIGSWCRINRVLFDHDGWRRYNHRPLNDDGRSRPLDHDRGCRSRLICVGVSFPMVAWNFTVLRRWGYRQIGGHCWRGKSQCARHTQDRFMHDASFVDYALSSPNKATPKSAVRFMNGRNGQYCPAGVSGFSLVMEGPRRRIVHRVTFPDYGNASRRGSSADVPPLKANDAVVVHSKS